MESFQAASSRMDRKTRERDRRTEMKALVSQLSSLLPPQKGSTMLTDTLEQAAAYINDLHARIAELEKKQKGCFVDNADEKQETVDEEVKVDSEALQLEIRRVDSALLVGLYGGLDSQCMFYRTIRALEEEGAEVVSAGSSTVGGKIFHSIHTQVTDPRVELPVSRVSEKLKMLVQEFTRVK